MLTALRTYMRVVRRCANPVNSSNHFTSSCKASMSTASQKRDCHRYIFRHAVPYGQALRWQQDIMHRRITLEPPEKYTDASGVVHERRHEHQDILIMLQHQPVYTLGRGASESDLIFMKKNSGNETIELGDLQRGGGVRVSVGGMDADLYRVERGGKITYHGPGQLVAYPLLDLTKHRKDLHWYVTTIEDVIIDSLGEYGIVSGRYKGYPGVWVGEEKIAQVGMNCSKWFTIHGFAINVTPDMSHFNHIVPCGIQDKAVTSMAKLLGKPIDVDEVAGHVTRHFARRFNVEIKDITGEPTDTGIKDVVVHTHDG